MTTSENSQRNHHNNNNNNNTTTKSSKNNNNHVQNQPIPSTGINNEVILVVSQPNNDAIGTMGEEVMRPQVQTFVVETTLHQSNIITTTNTPPFSTTRSWGMPPLSNDMNISQMNMPMTQSWGQQPWLQCWTTKKYACSY